MIDIAFETITVADTAIGPTSSAIEDATYGGANYAVFGPVETAQIRYSTNGEDPTTTVGHLLEVGDTLIYDGDLSGIQFIRTGATSGSLPASYYLRG